MAYSHIAHDCVIGDKAVLIGRVIPIMREMISVPAGLLKMKIPKFILVCF